MILQYEGSDDSCGQPKRVYLPAYVRSIAGGVVVRAAATSGGYPLSNSRAQGLLGNCRGRVDECHPWRSGGNRGPQKWIVGTPEHNDVSPGGHEWRDMCGHCGTHRHRIGIACFDEINEPDTCLADHLQVWSMGAGDVGQEFTLQRGCRCHNTNYPADTALCGWFDGGYHADE